MRHLALTASLLALTAAPALSQAHSGSHDRSSNHEDVVRRRREHVRPEEDGLMKAARLCARE